MSPNAACGLLMKRAGRGVCACTRTVEVEMDPYLGPGALVPSLSADQCAPALAQTGMNPPPPAQHVQPKALPVASMLVKPASTLTKAAVTHTGGTKFASGMELVAEEIKAA